MPEKEKPKSDFQSKVYHEQDSGAVKRLFGEGTGFWTRTWEEGSSDQGADDRLRGQRPQDTVGSMSLFLPEKPLGFKGAVCPQTPGLSYPQPVLFPSAFQRKSYL